MSLWSGATKIDAVYLGGGGSGTTSWIPIACRGGRAGKSGTAAFAGNYAGDLLVMVLSDSASSTPQNAPSGWTKYPQHLSSSGLGNNFYSAIYYKFATGPQATQSITSCDWMTLVFSGVKPDSPFGAYAQQENGSTRNHTAPAITRQQTNGFGEVFHLYCTKGASGSWNATSPAGTYLVSGLENQWNQWALTRADKTTAAVPAQVATTSASQPSFAHTIELLPDSRYVEPGMCQAVFLGPTKVWPEYTAAETHYKTAGNHAYTIPTGATYLDIVAIGGGGGGNGSIGGAGANGNAGSCGGWQSFSLTVGTDIQAGEVLAITCGAGGQGGTALVPGSSAAGSPTTVTYRSTTKTAAGGTNAAQPTMNGGTGTLPYNGRTYNSGPGGAAGASGVNGGKGGDGTAPGAGGGGGISLVSSSGGGAGAAGGVWIYAY